MINLNDSRLRVPAELQMMGKARWRTRFAASWCMLLCGVLSGCSDRPSAPNEDPRSTGSSAYTLAANQWFTENLPLDDSQDFADARRGLMAVAPGSSTDEASDNMQWVDDLDAYRRDDAPDTVNPSLWRQAKLNAISGLFKVDDGVYQLRGFDLANTTLIRADNGWIIVDPLTSLETTTASIAFAQKHLGKIVPTAIIITHSHIDHFGGIDAWMSAAPSADVQIIAPQGFMREATSENILAGTAMTRRASYMFGFGLENTPKGHVDSGLGRRVISGHTSIRAPTTVIDRAEQRLQIDGVDFVFYNMPNSEAPAELTFYMPQKKIFCGAELVSHTLHNILTLRGAKVRDALAWSEYIGISIERLNEVEILVNSHHWPTWGHRRIIEQLEQQQDVYRFIHDQTLRLANRGYTPTEIAEQLKLPPSLVDKFHVRGYYGTVSHNSKAVYQHYFGWYDGNPANLNRLPPVSAAQRYVALMGGVKGTIAAAAAAADKGEYRWAAELLNHVVFADSDNREATNLLAESYRQLGYQAESGPWRDIYLSAAKELQQGNQYRAQDLRLARKFLRKVPLEEFMKTIAVRLDPNKAAGKDYKLNIHFPEENTNFVLWLRNSVLHYRKNHRDETADASISVGHDFFIDLMLGEVGLTNLLLSDQLTIEGNRIIIIELLAMLDSGDDSFNIVTP